MTDRRRIVVIVGPTAGGKSELAVAIAQACGGQIINADSMQVYRHLNVGTAKPNARQRAAATHHLIDCVEPTENWTLANWLEAAEALIADLHQRGVLPIVVGGTNLYLKALLEGMFDGPPADPAFRTSVENTPAHELHDQLAQADPQAAGQIHRNDHKRIVRALEVYRATGKPITELQEQWDRGARHGDAEARRHEEEQDRSSKIEEHKYRHDPILIGLDWPTELINRRINARVREMFKPANQTEDLISETRRLLDANLLGSQAAEALGTKQVLAHLAGQYSADRAFEQVKIQTRRYAKQQRTWLRRYRGVHWLAAGEQSARELIAEAIEVVKRELGNSD